MGLFLILLLMNTIMKRKESLEEHQMDLTIEEWAQEMINTRYSIVSLEECVHLLHTVESESFSYCEEVLSDYKEDSNGIDEEL
jgi:hypothetical protein